MTQAIIIGGGIGGLATGVALQQIGIEAHVFERVPVLQPVGAGLSLWVNALRALHALGVSVPAPTHSGMSGLHMPDGSLLMGMAQKQTEEPMVVTVHRAELQQWLKQRLAPNTLHLGKACHAIEQDTQKVVARFADGSEAEGDILIGADGIHSMVRAHMYPQDRLIYSGYTAWRAVVPFETSRLQTGETIGAGQRFGQLALAGNRAYWFATHDEPQGAQAPNGDEKAYLQTLFASWHKPIPALLEATPADVILRNDIYDRPTLKQWVNGRFALLGDAAHPMTPNMGQGACQALEDAVVLGRALQASHSMVEGLHLYEQKRRGRANQFVRQSRLLGAVNQWSHPIGMTTRNMTFKYLAPFARKFQMRSLVAFS